MAANITQLRKMKVYHTLHDKRMIVGEAYAQPKLIKSTAFTTVSAVPSSWITTPTLKCNKSSTRRETPQQACCTQALPLKEPLRPAILLSRTILRSKDKKTTIHQSEEANFGFCEKRRKRAWGRTLRLSKTKCTSPALGGPGLWGVQRSVKYGTTSK